MMHEICVPKLYGMPSAKPMLQDSHCRYCREMYGFHADRCMDFSMSSPFLGSSKKLNNKINQLPLSRLATQQTRPELNSRLCTGLIRHHNPPHTKMLFATFSFSLYAHPVAGNSISSHSQVFPLHCLLQ